MGSICTHCLNESATEREWLPQPKCYRNLLPAKKQEQFLGLLRHFGKRLNFRFDRNMMRSSISSKTAPKEERYFAPRNVVLARSSIERISVAPTDEATRSGNPAVAEQ